MRTLSILLVLLLLSLLTAAASAASAHALGLPTPEQVRTLVAPEDEEDEAIEEDGEEAEDESDEGEDPVIAALRACEGTKDEERCEEEVVKEAEAEECLIEDADAAVKLSPGNGKVRLSVRYRSFEPTAVSVVASLRGGKGGLHLGQDSARFRRRGVYHNTFKLGGRQLAKALAARQFSIDLLAAGAPAECALHLTASRAGAKPRWS